MIKASSRTALGQPMLFLGLSGENVTRLAAGEPIRITTAHLAQLGLPATTFGKLAANKPPAGNPETNPSRAYEQRQAVILDELGADLGCKPH